MWKYSKMAIAMAARMRRARITLPCVEPTAAGVSSASASEDGGDYLDFLQHEFPGVDPAVLEEMDEEWEGDISDDAAELLRIASNCITRARALTPD
jgi:hypothetical protein